MDLGKKEQIAEKVAYALGTPMKIVMDTSFPLADTEVRIEEIHGDGKDWDKFYFEKIPTESTIEKRFDSGGFFVS